MADILMSLFLGLAFLVMPLGAESLPGVRDLRVTDASGQVTVKTAENPKQAAVVDEETPLAEEDLLVTGPKSGAEITMDGESVFKLQPGSSLRIKSLSRQNTLFEMTQGTMLAKVKPATGPDQGLYIKMPTAVVAIRGTEFAVESGVGISQVGVFDEGHVAVGGLWGHAALKLSPHQETKVTRSNVPEPPHELTYFRPLKTQMPRLRNRAVFWRAHWRPISNAGKQGLRRRLADPHRSKSPGFYRLPAAHRPIRRTLQRHHSHAKSSTSRRSRLKRHKPVNQNQNN